MSSLLPEEIYLEAVCKDLKEDVHVLHNMCCLAAPGLFFFFFFYQRLTKDASLVFRVAFNVSVPLVC